MSACVCVCVVMYHLHKSSPNNNLIEFLLHFTLPLFHVAAYWQTHTHKEQLNNGWKAENDYSVFYFLSPLFMCFSFFCNQCEPQELTRTVILLCLILWQNQIKMLFISHPRCFVMGFHKDTHMQTHV